jgi:hypothetical protein
LQFIGFSSFVKAKIEGPEPDIPEPKAPFSNAVCLINQTN